MRGYENEFGEKYEEVLKILNEGDLVEIEFYSFSNDKRVTELFYIPRMPEDRYRFVLFSVSMGYTIKNFIICNHRFHDEDIAECNPIIKGIIFKNDLHKIKHEVDGIQIKENKLEAEKALEQPALKKLTRKDN
jgi:hypothetical protein